MHIPVTLAQTHILYGNVKANVEHMRDIAANLPPGSLLLLPELWSSSYDLDHSAIISRENEAALQQMAETARRRRLFIGGSLLLEMNSELVNSFNLADPDGAIIAQYQKIHLFRLMQEHEWMQPGNNPLVVDLHGIKVGLAICYDLRFPELFRYYAAQGCKLILVSAEWPIRRVAHWKVLLQARAIENQCFVAGVGNVGDTGGSVYGGSSLLVDPWGRILLEGSGTDEQILSAEIDPAIADEFRQKIPALHDRRTDLYTDWM